MLALCGICTDACPAKKKPIVCSKCGMIACTTCMQRMFLQSPVYKFSCVSCNHAFSYEHVYGHFSKLFWRHKYREYVCQQILRIEANRLPSTMSFVADKHSVIDTKVKISSLRKQYAELSSQQVIIKNSITELQRSIRRDVDSHPRYINCCNVDCRAYVTHNEPQCIVCQETTCSVCHCRVKSLDGIPHTCDEHTVETISIIQKECRECPACHVHIQKIDGCDQMFCTRCNTPFSWKTGEVITGPFNNPHLVIRESEREVEGRCSGLPVRHVVSLLLSSKCADTIVIWVMGVYDMLVRFRRVELHKIRNSRCDFNTHLQSRIAIIEREQTEATCISKWYKVEQNARLCTELCDVMSSYLSNMEGFFQQACPDIHCNTSESRIHWLLVGPAKVLTRRYIDFFTRTYDRYFAKRRRIVAQLLKHDQSFPHGTLTVSRISDDLL
jgi:hypothetical protein